MAVDSQDKVPLEQAYFPLAQVAEALGTVQACQEASFGLEVACAHQGMMPWLDRSDDAAADVLRVTVETVDIWEAHVGTLLTAHVYQRRRPQEGADQRPPFLRLDGPLRERDLETGAGHCGHEAPVQRHAGQRALVGGLRALLQRAFAPVDEILVLVWYPNCSSCFFVKLRTP